MTNPTPAPLSAEQLTRYDSVPGEAGRMIIDQDDNGAYVLRSDVLALIAQARAAQPAQTQHVGTISVLGGSWISGSLDKLDAIPDGIHSVFIAAQAHHAAAMTGEDARERVRDAIAAALGDAYDCLRVWSAWGYGTMGPDDFSVVANDDDRLNEITDAAIAAMSAPNAIQKEGE